MSTERPALIEETKMANYITFLVLPVFSSTPSSSVLVPSIREPLRVSCSAKGSPLPTVTWYKNDVNLPVINKVTDNEFTSELVIGEFQPADQATYKCVARNVYNNTVETSTRICKSNVVDENSITVVKHFFLAKLAVDGKKVRRNVIFGLRAVIFSVSFFEQQKSRAKQ